MKIAEDLSPICIKPDWTAQTENARECYNFTIDEDHDPRNINILESEGFDTVARPTVECLEIIKKLKIKKVNIGTEGTPNIASIGNYWDDKTIGQIVVLLQEYQENPRRSTCWRRRRTLCRKSYSAESVDSRTMVANSP